jgi:epoxyqueuosine reductase
MAKREEVAAAAWIESSIKGFVESSENSLKNRENEPGWAEPLLGFSRGDDPLYSNIKNDIGPFYWTPLEIFEKTFPSLKVTSDRLTIISWILPQMEVTKLDNRKEAKYPSERWVRSRKFGEEFNIKLHDHMVGTLRKAGYETVAPSRSPLWSMKTSEQYGLSSTWSERHAAYVSGLGTFGLCDGLITPAGKAMRCGSVISLISISPSRRAYKDHNEYCLFFSKGTCGKCIERCPAGAVTKEGHNKEACRNYLFSVTAPYAISHFGIEAYGCGLCQTGVPCESKIPLKKGKSTKM